MMVAQRKEERTLYTIEKKTQRTIYILKHSSLYKKGGEDK